MRTKARILIVPEEGSDARGLEECLQGFGYAVCGPASDRQALQNTLEMRPDLALVDLGLEGDVDGIEAAREIRTTGVPVVYLTDGAEEELQRAEATQPFGYVLKPFSEGQLHLNIRTALFMGERESRHRTLASCPPGHPRPAAQAGTPGPQGEPAARHVAGPPAHPARGAVDQPPGANPGRRRRTARGLD